MPAKKRHFGLADTHSELASRIVDAILPVVHFPPVAVSDGGGRLVRLSLVG